MVMAMRDIKRYQRTKLIFSFVGTGVFLLYTALWVRLDPTWLLEVSDNRWLGLLVFASVFAGLYELITLPLEYYAGYVVEHRFEQSNQSLQRWIWQTLKGYMVGAVIGGILLAGVYALLWYAGALWWLWMWLSWFALSVVVAQLFPVVILPIFYRASPIESEDLIAELSAVAQGTGIRVQGVHRLDISEDTKSANALLTGLGSTRRVYLSDTLLNAFSLEEIKVIFAHELGHHVRYHIWKGMALSVLMASLSVAVLVYFLEGSSAQDWRAPVAALPSCILTISLLSLLLKPLHNALSRRFERQCDTDALFRTRDPAAYRSAFQRLASMNLADPEPHPLVEWYCHDHPAISKRLALADRFEAGQLQSS